MTDSQTETAIGSNDSDLMPTAEHLRTAIGYIESREIFRVLTEVEKEELASKFAVMQAMGTPLDLAKTRHEN
jgi:hypothetical protein